MFELNSFEFDMNAFMAALLMPMFGKDLFELHMKNKEMRKLMESEEKFDVCVLEIFMSDAFLVSQLTTSNVFEMLRQFLFTGSC